MERDKTFGFMFLVMEAVYTLFCYHGLIVLVNKGLEARGYGGEVSICCAVAELIPIYFSKVTLEISIGSLSPSLSAQLITRSSFA